MPQNPCSQGVFAAAGPLPPGTSTVDSRPHNPPRPLCLGSSRELEIRCPIALSPVPGRGFILSPPLRGLLSVVTWLLLCWRKWLALLAIL